MKKIVLSLIFSIVFFSYSFSNDKKLISPNINDNISTNNFVENLDYTNCFSFALAVYDAAMVYGDSSFAYDMMISAFNVCSRPQ